VLKGITTKIHRGEVVCVIGPSGSGKSTFLRCLNLLEQPTSGKVVVDGVEVTDLDCDIDKVRADMGMVFQQFNLFPHLSVLENCTIAQLTVPQEQQGGGREARPHQPRAVGLLDKEAPSPVSSPAASSSAWRLRGRCRWSPN
jgi:polar amino acid transport system ATP-binding protein